MDEALCITGHDALLAGMEGAVYFLDHYLWQAANQPPMDLVGGMYTLRSRSLNISFYLLLLLFFILLLLFVFLFVFFQFSGLLSRTFFCMSQKIFLITLDDLLPLFSNAVITPGSCSLPTTLLVLKS